ncbi:MAG: integrase domain-containing protein [Gammaproteobacteria bacterium]|nr:integrase domain-containing protein [Gammaproteobacteria bacterium]
MSRKHQLKESIYVIMKHSRDGSYATRTDRKRTLNLVADELYLGGYKVTHVNGLKQKHVRYLNDSWKAKGLSSATIKNRNSALRWLCEHTGRSNVVPSNDELGIAKRKSSSDRNKAVDLTKVDLAKITNRNVLVQLQLQRYLGLRREESIKFKPFQADKGNCVELQASWCKGGRARTVPVHTDKARYWIDEAKKLVNQEYQSLIPTDQSYIQHRNLYDKQVQKAGIKHAHGLRHAYAQERYRELTGWDCPVCGGPHSKDLAKKQKELDAAARLIISEELGHSRERVTINYLWT